MGNLQRRRRLGSFRCALARRWLDVRNLVQAPAANFVKAQREGWERGVSIIHFLGAHTADIVENRAVAQTKMTISQRAPVHGVLCDVVCTGRFYDFLEKRDGRWGFVRRQSIYEKDRLDPVDPKASIELDPAVLNRFPEGYRHLAYLQTQVGYKVKEQGMPGLKGPKSKNSTRRGKPGSKDRQRRDSRFKAPKYTSRLFCGGALL